MTGQMSKGNFAYEFEDAWWLWVQYFRTSVKDWVSRSQYPIVVLRYAVFTLNTEAVMNEWNEFEDRPLQSSTAKNEAFLPAVLQDLAASGNIRAEKTVACLYSFMVRNKLQNRMVSFWNSIPEAWKWDLRKQVWNYLEDNNLADFPRPVHHRIPNFKGSAKAGERLAELPEFINAKVVKVNPDTPQKSVRVATLRSEKSPICKVDVLLSANWELMSLKMFECLELGKSWACRNAQYKIISNMMLILELTDRFWLMIFGYQKSQLFWMFLDVIFAKPMLQVASNWLCCVLNCFTEYVFLLLFSPFWIMTAWLAF